MSSGSSKSRRMQAVHKTPGGEALTPQQLKVQEEFVRRATGPKDG